MDEEILEVPQGIAPDIKCRKYSDGKWEAVTLSVPKEMAFTIYINSQELVTILCTPFKLNCLVLGYLYAENIINDMKEVTSMRVCEDDALADVKLSRNDFTLPQKRILTSGCGGGISLNTSVSGPRIVSELKITPEQLLSLMKKMLESAELYRITGGIHTSAISDGRDILVIGEDIGRHNTLDKIMGECLLRKTATKDKILLTSGRVSSEMLRKAAQMQTPIICSLTSPTERAVLLARDLDITLVGYARGGHLTVYSKPERIATSV